MRCAPGPSLRSHGAVGRRCRGLPRRPRGQPCRCPWAWLTDARDDGGQRQPLSETTRKPPARPAPLISGRFRAFPLSAACAFSEAVLSSGVHGVGERRPRSPVRGVHTPLLPETREQPLPLPCRATAASLESLGQVLCLHRGWGGRQRPLGSSRFPLPSLGPRSRRSTVASAGRSPVT